MRGHCNLKFQRGGSGDFDFDLGAHFASHSVMMRHSLRIRQASAPVVADGCVPCEFCRGFVFESSIFAPFRLG
jgi:hypothetical protein